MPPDTLKAVSYAHARDEFHAGDAVADAALEELADYGSRKRNTLDQVATPVRSRDDAAFGQFGALGVSGPGGDRRVRTVAVAARRALGHAPGGQERVALLMRMQRSGSPASFHMVRRW